jgi:hypothetical protein
MGNGSAYLLPHFHSVFIQYFAFNFRCERNLNNTCRSPLYNGQYDIVCVRV